MNQAIFYVVYIPHLKINAYLCSIIKTNDNIKNTTIMEENKRTYDVEFNNDTDSNSKGIHGTYEECMDWIEFNRGDESTYFGDYKGGIVSIVCEQTGEHVYIENI